MARVPSTLAHVGSKGSIVRVAAAGAGDPEELARAAAGPRTAAVALHAAGGSAHSYPQEEHAAVCSWINAALAGDAELASVLPIPAAGPALFEACKSGITIAKLINCSVPGAVPERAINRKARHPMEVSENITAALKAARTAGCSVVNIDAEDIKAGTPHLVLGLLWQVMRVGLVARVSASVAAGGGSTHLLLADGETAADLRALSPENIILRWVNYHLARSPSARRIANFAADIKDSEVYAHLLRQIAPPAAGVDLSPLAASDEAERAERVLQQADKIRCRLFVTPADIVAGNAKLNFFFAAHLYNTYPAWASGAAAPAPAAPPAVAAPPAAPSPAEAAAEPPIPDLPYADAEKAAFCRWINLKFADADDLGGVVPIAVEGPALFEAARKGVILCKLVNDAVADTIDVRTINRKPSTPAETADNIALFLNSAAAIGCDVTHIAAEEVLAGSPPACLEVIWSVLRVGLSRRINVERVPALAALQHEDESLQELSSLALDQILLRWVNHHLQRAGAGARSVANFGKDVADAEALTILVHMITPDPTSARPPHHADAADPAARAERMLRAAGQLGAQFITAADVTGANTTLNLAFAAHLFLLQSGLRAPEAARPADLEGVHETREELTYRNWMNSLGVKPFVRNLYQGLADGLVFLQLFDLIQPGIVDWKRVNMPPWKGQSDTMKRIENDNYAVELGRQMNFSLVGINGKNLFDGNKTLTLALLWQMMRAHALSILQKLGGGAKVADAEIIAWANKRLQAAGKATSIRSFKDAALATALPIIDLVDAIKPNAVNYKIVLPAPAGPAEQTENARYAISMARKIGAAVFALPQDVVELKDKMIMTLFATLMSVAKGA